jgi:hypothetical protein
MSVIDLGTLLDRARIAGPLDCIEFRDPIVACGERALDAMTDWLADPRHAAFAVRVLERIGRKRANRGAVVTTLAAVDREELGRELTDEQRVAWRSRRIPSTTPEGMRLATWWSRRACRSTASRATSASAAAAAGTPVDMGAVQPDRVRAAGGAARGAQVPQVAGRERRAALDAAPTGAALADRHRPARPHRATLILASSLATARSSSDATG